VQVLPSESLQQNGDEQGQYYVHAQHRHHHEEHYGEVASVGAVKRNCTEEAGVETRVANRIL
jgi:hypothetical protein